MYAVEEVGLLVIMRCEKNVVYDSLEDLDAVSSENTMECT